MQWIKDQSITVKMVFLVGVMLTIAMMISGFGLTKMDRISTEIKGIAHQHIPLIQLISDATVKQLQSTLIVEKALRVADFATSVEQMDVAQLKDLFSQLSLSLIRKLMRPEFCWRKHNNLHRQMRYGNRKSCY
ncbi:hypothetical protein P4S72_01105 [Vibrio sp. PP-XX7]